MPKKKKTILRGYYGGKLVKEVDITNFPKDQLIIIKGKTAEALQCLLKDIHWETEEKN